MMSDGYFIKAEQLQDVMSGIEDVFNKFQLKTLEREIVLDILRDLEKKRSMLRLQKKTLDKTMNMSKLLFQRG